MDRANKTRRLQFIGGQFLLNIPQRLVKRFHWKKGDYFNVEVTDDEVLEVWKVANWNVDRAEALLPGIHQEIIPLLNTLMLQPERLGPVEFSWALAQFSEKMAKFRRYRQAVPRLNPGR